MEYEIIRGKNQIGGTITEIRTITIRLWVDFGMELSVKDPYASDDFVIEKMKTNPPAAVLFTHIHGDHIGLLHAIPDGVKIYIGPVALEMMKNIRKTLLHFNDLAEDEREKLQKEMDILTDSSRVVCYKNKECMDVGGIKVTPFEVDHSAADAYMLRFEAEDYCIVHTGDFRNHGRRGKNLLMMMKKEVASVPVNVLITEGTMMSRTSEEILSEEQMKEEAQKVFEENKYAFLICSSTNMESLSSFYWAMIDAGKKRSEKPPLIVNSYVKMQLELYTKSVGKDDWHFRFHRSYSIQKALNQILSNDKTQKQQMVDEGFVMMVGTSEYYQQLMEEFREYNPILIYSMWDGYLKKNKDYTNQDLINVVEKWEPNVVHLHTSGHASPETVANVIEAVNPSEAIVPVHTENPEGFKKLKINAVLRKKIRI